jgi:hypothetical protein
MRRSGHDTGLVCTENSSEIFGVKLAGDYCAEHEEGIGHLKMMLGIDSFVQSDSSSRIVGIEKRKMTKLAGNRAMSCDYGLGLAFYVGDQVPYDLQASNTDNTPIIKVKGLPENLSRGLPQGLRTSKTGKITGEIGSAIAGKYIFSKIENLKQANEWIDKNPTEKYISGAWDKSEFVVHGIHGMGTKKLPHQEDKTKTVYIHIDKDHYHGHNAY